MSNVQIISIKPMNITKSYKVSKDGGIIGSYLKIHRINKEKLISKYKTNPKQKVHFIIVVNNIPYYLPLLNALLDDLWILLDIETRLNLENYCKVENNVFKMELKDVSFSTSLFIKLIER